MKATPSEIQNYLAVISETPQRIASMGKGLDETRLKFRAGPNSWSANDILTHLRSCADLWTHSIYAMLAEKEPAFPDVDERRWARVTRYEEISFTESLKVFELQRDHLLRILLTLPFESWERFAMIAVRKHTVFSKICRMAKHEQEHIEQLEALLRRG